LYFLVGLDFNIAFVLFCILIDPSVTWQIPVTELCSVYRNHLLILHISFVVVMILKHLWEEDMFVYNAMCRNTKHIVKKGADANFIVALLRGRFGALKSDSTHHFFRNACTKSGSLRFSQFSGCWLILSVFILMSFDFPFVRLFGVR
jgi:hypothetical protein